MPVRTYDYVTYSGTVTPSAIGTETTIVEITGDGTHPFIVEGWLDLSSLANGDTVTVTEYVSVDGTNYGVYLTGDFNGVQDMPIIRFHTKTFLPIQKYKLTITQSAGTLRGFPYAFISELIEKF